jgi:3-oxoacyl-[acyl-carrier protein] reductase
MDGQTAVITGASCGIGRAVAMAFADAGAHVVICARDQDAIEETATEIRDAGGDVTESRADVRDEYDVERLMERAAQVGDTIDCVVANAGVYHGAAGATPLSTESYAAFDDHMRTNARGAFSTLRESLPHLAEDARLLVTSGVVARERFAGYGSYAVSKAATEAVARGFAADTEYAVCVLDPGQVATDLTGGEGRAPDSVAQQFRWAVEDAPAELFDGGVLDREVWQRHVS